jgi:DNA-binding CsgD family transcriptional regulator
VLYGRERERGILDAMLLRAPENGDAVVVRGEPGIGKSSLLAVAAAQARDRGFQVLTATGVESATDLPFAGLHQLLRPVAWDPEALPSPQRDAMLAAFGRSSSAAPDLYLVALAALDLLSDAASRAPVLVIAEDAQWLDRPTCDVLAFIARRLESDPILLLFAVREGCQSALLDAGLKELALAGLNEADSAALLHAHAPRVRAAVRRRLLHEAGGNPLALVELAAAFHADGLQDRAEVPAPLPLTARLERAFTSRFVELPAAARTALLVAAMDDGAELTEVLNAASIVGSVAVTLDSLAPAVSARLVEVGQTELRFHHPLIRSAIHQAASLSDRLAAHAALAIVLEGQPDRQAWHRAASVLGRNEEAAAGLDDAAARARARGAIVVSVSALERAADLTPDPARRAERLLRAAELAFEAGRRDLVARLVREADSLAPLVRGPLEQARMTLVRGLGVPRILPTHRVRSLVDIAERARDAGDSDLAWNLLWLVAQRCFWADPGQEARDIVVSAAERFGAPDDEPRALAILAYAAPLDRAEIVIDRISRWPSDIGGAEAARLLGSAAVVVGAFDLATRFVAAATDGLRAQGRLGHLARALVMQAWCAICVADWRVAVPAADEAGRLAAETAEPAWAAGAQAMKAIVAAIRGEPDRAAALTLEAERAVVSTGASHMLAYVQVARGLAALGQGQYADAYDQLRRIFDPADPAHHQVPCCWYVGDLAEAAAHSGHRETARALVEEIAPLIERTPSSWIRAAMRYARAQLADDADAERLFRAALDADIAHWPFQRARLLLAYGAWLRRRRRAAESRTPLRVARDTFDALGVVQWAERARQELRAAGELSRRRTPEAWDQLSPQEIQIATLAAGGLSNRDIARKLYLSHRTVGSHLYRIFPKLGVTSRAQLGGALTTT